MDEGACLIYRGHPVGGVSPLYRVNGKFAGHRGDTPSLTHTHTHTHTRNLSLPPWETILKGKVLSGR